MKKHLLFACTFCISLFSSAQIPTNGLVSSYEFDGALLADSAGSNTLTTNNQPVLGNGYQNVIQTAANFNADGMLSSSSSDFLASSFTLSGWVHLTNTNAYHTIGNVRLQTTSFPYNSFNLVAGSAVSNYLTFYFNTDIYLSQGNPSNDMVLQDLTGPLSLNVWYHVAVTVNFNATSNTTTINLYRDGVQVNTTDAYGQIVYNGNPFTLGNIFGAPDNSNGLRGSLDEVLFYNRALTPLEICQMHSTYMNSNCSLEVAAPTNLTASANGTLVTLNWIDNSTNESYFRVATSIDGVNFANILGDVPANTTTYSYTANAGTHYYRVFAYSQFDTSAVSNIATVTVTSTAGINENSTEWVELFPNPTKEFLTIRVASPANFDLITLQGKSLKVGSIDKELILNVSDLTAGVYFIKIENGASVRFTIE